MFHGRIVSAISPHLAFFLFQDVFIGVLLYSLSTNALHSDGEVMITLSGLNTNSANIAIVALSHCLLGGAPGSGLTRTSRVVLAAPPTVHCLRVGASE